MNNINLFNKKTIEHKVLKDIDDDIQTIIFTQTSRNPLSVQGIKIREKVYHLIYFEKSPTNLTYEFEKGVSLKFYFRNNVIIIRVINPKFKMDFAKVWPQQYASKYVSVSWNDLSKELDYINILSYENSKI